jgi:hypothetical protein
MTKQEDAPPVKLTVKTRRGLRALVPLAEGYLSDEASDRLSKAERAEMKQAMQWIRELPR